MKKRRYPLAIQLFFLSRTGLLGLHRLIQTGLAGLWLGILNRDAFHRLDQIYYDTHGMYFSDDWNRRGLFAWEADAIGDHFAGCRRLLVGGVGGGRELLALLRMGYEVDGFECHAGLVRVANDLLRREGLDATAKLAPRDECPCLDRQYDGIVVGWSAYMLIPGRAKRIAFLKSLRAQAREGAPLLVSFYTRSGRDRRFRIVAAIANTVRRILRRERIELGDDMDTGYVHYFTREEIADEFGEAAFDLVSYSTKGYGHAVGLAAIPCGIKAVLRAGCWVL